MANRKATMTDLRVIIREFAKGTPLREIERRLGISRTSLRPYKERAEQSGKSMQELLQLEDAELHNVLSKGDGHRSRDADKYAFMQENVESYAQSMKRKYMTYDVLYEEYCKATDNPYGYTQFKLIIQEYEKAHDYKYHNVYEAAKEMQFSAVGACRQEYGRMRKGDSPRLCASVLDDELRDSDAVNKDGVLLRCIIKGIDVLRWCS